MKGRKLALVILVFIFQLLSATSVDGSVSPVAYRVFGNAYPLGYYYVYLFIGTPPKPYELLIDTGSIITWIQGEYDELSLGCLLPTERLYRPSVYKFLPCTDPICVSFAPQMPEENRNPDAKCIIGITYVDGTKVTIGVALDYMLMLQVDSSFHNIGLAIGCAYYLDNEDHPNAFVSPGILGLGKGKETIPSQLSGMHLTQNVIGHCFQQEGGFLFLGADLVPENGMNWIPLSDDCMPMHYCAGPAVLLHDGDYYGWENLLVTFDTGSPYTYLSSKVYNAVSFLIRKDVRAHLQDVRHHKFKVCWKDEKPIKAVQDVSNYFRTLSLRFFTEAGTIQLDLPPEAYLVATEQGSICLGIRNAAEIGGLKDRNLIGAISMQNKLIVYDNEKQRIGWASADCSRIKNRKPVDQQHYKGKLYSIQQNTN